MSLDVYLYDAEPSPEGSGIFVREHGQVREITRAEWDERFPGREPVVVERESEGPVYSRNITHNLTKMADQAEIYNVVWRPDENGVTAAAQLIEPLRAGLERLRADPERYKKFNPSNGWGDYEGLVNFTEDYLRACETYPAARVEVSR